MTYPTLAPPTHRNRWDRVRIFLAPGQAETDTQDRATEDSRAGRDFILEMLDRHPDGFHSETDIQDMARLYRCKF